MSERLTTFSLAAGGGILLRKHDRGIILEYTRVPHPVSIVMDWREATQLKEELESLGATNLPPRTEY